MTLFSSFQLYLEIRSRIFWTPFYFRDTSFGIIASVLAKLPFFFYTNQISKLLPQIKVTIAIVKNLYLKVVPP